MRLTAVIAMFPGLREAELAAWVERGWVRPEGVLPEGVLPTGVSSEGAPSDWDFAEIDVARVRLIRDVRHTMAVSEDTMPLVLSLLDQVYTLRGQLRAVARAVETQPDSVRVSILSALLR